MSKNRRLSKIFAGDGKSITLALDGYNFSTHTEGVDNTILNLPGLLEHGLDNVLVTYGMAKVFEDYFNDVAMVLRADLSTNVFDPSVPDTAGFFSVKDALKLGADGVVCMTFAGAKNENASNEIEWRLAREADEWNMPLIAETLPFGYPVTTPESNDPKNIAATARLGTELGADVIKTRFTGLESDKLIVEAARRPVLALGGPKTGIEGYFKFVKHCMDVGAKGVAVGRNITQNPNPVGVVAGLNTIIHKNGSAEEALEIYNSTESK